MKIPSPHQYLKIFILSFLSLSLAPTLSVYASLGEQPAPLRPEEYHGTSAVGAGFASSFLPYKKGELFTQNYQLKPHPLLKQEEAPHSLMEHFERARTQVLKTAPTGDAHLPLAKIYESMALDPEAFDWEGRCNNWSAASSDPLIRQLAPAKGLICGDTYFSRADLHELFTMTYYAAESQRGYGLRTEAKNDEKEVHKVNLKLYGHLGDVNFLPHVFHREVHSHLRRENGEGVVMDEDPSEEIWNQPIHQIDSEVAEVTDLDAKDIEELPPVIGMYFYTPTTAQSQRHMQKVRDMSWAMRLLKDADDKKKDTRPSEVYAKLARKGKGVVATKTLERIKAHEQAVAAKLKAEADAASANPAPAPVLGPDGKKIEKPGLLTLVTDAMVADLYSELKEARTHGLTLKRPYKLYSVKSDVHYLEETKFREDDRAADGVHIDKKFTIKDTYKYFFVVEAKGKKGGPKPPEEHKYFSYWVGDKAEGKRPDFIWVPQCQTETCEADAKRYYEEKIREMRKTQTDDEIVATMVWGDSDSDEDDDDGSPVDIKEDEGHLPLTIGLNDLLRLYKNCTPLEKAEEKLGAFTLALDGVKATQAQGGAATAASASDADSAAARLTLQTAFEELKVLNLPLDEEAVSARLKEAGLRLPAPGEGDSILSL